MVYQVGGQNQFKAILGLINWFFHTGSQHGYLDKMTESLCSTGF